MTPRGDGSFEWLRERLPTLQAAASADDRDLVWVDESRTVAVSRDTEGRLELFLPGPPLASALKPVADSLSHHQWWFDDGGTLDASRLQFAEAPHFDGVVSFLCAELMRNGAATDLPQAFSRTEPAIALALARAALGSEVLVGLAGELLLIDGLTRVAAGGEERRAVISGWAGSVPSSRDFRLGTTGIEVKTTSGTSSKHHVQGLHQVEVGHADGGEVETGLYLLSIGLRWTDAAEGGTTIPSLVEAISNRLEADDREAFHQRLTQYGGDAGSGYRHDRDKFVATYARPFTTRFERLYDMGDPRIRLPRRGDLETFSDLDIDSLSFRVDLPGRVRGDLNPVVGWQAILARLHGSVDPA
ncbi:PD-(D/E)XK motif protein [Nocardioides deserti]|uniref:PD-(D/E)XK motif protein n=1 Tax=Nocardioides deserti TaxID=1588644 RepID=A0ABR6UA48_9ACTN|nr:PD-(D/E)XK motif protein [Nocardioides deserti]MBC2961243.1 PD-(D/E)XK motif protein [Nocardioides deserti]GGO72170.1 hypothetical protein GCM10012276_14880 [Nocardioides deserti]